MEALTITRDSELLKKAEGLIREAAALDIDLGRLGLGKKIESIKKSIEGDISIVFLGNISDGKTSIIAGCAGRVLDGMDIRADESTDEVKFYPELAAQGFVPADTPGLFGTKEKDEGGEKIRFSEKTERFVSEAGVVIFVCDAGAGAPIKNSCAPLIKKILRDFGLLESTIFVLNKMDTVCRMSDPRMFQQMSEIKKDALLKTLGNAVGDLTEEEKLRLRERILCIAADPGAKGLKKYWFTDEHRDGYEERSNIGALIDVIKGVVSKTDEEKVAVKMRQTRGGVRDVFIRLREALNEIRDPLDDALGKCGKSCEKLEEEAGTLKAELEKTRENLKTDLDNCKAAFDAKLDSAGADTIDRILRIDFGAKENKENGSVRFSKVEREIKKILDKAESEANSAVKARKKRFADEFKKQEKALEEAKDKCMERLRKLPPLPDEQHVDAVQFAKHLTAKIKLKDASAFLARIWNATRKFVSSLLEKAPLAGSLLSSLLYDKEADEARAEKMGAETVNVLDETFLEVGKLTYSGTFYEKIAPNCDKLLEMLEAREGEIESLKELVAKRDAFAQKIDAEMAKLGK